MFIDRQARHAAALSMAGMLVALPLMAAPAQPLLNAMFQEHAVLQRDQPVPVWGEAKPGDQITVSFDGRTVRSRADASGHWRVNLPATAAGGPYTLEARTQSGASQSVADVLVGDVWLCSGQSNMELPVSGTLNAERETSGSAIDAIRVLTVAHAVSPTALQEFAAPVSWQAAAPSVIRGFSAACYYFARELRKTVAVPMGLIQSTWGGSSIEPWIGDAGLRVLGGYDQRLDLLRLYAHDPSAGNRGFADLWERWWRAHAPAGSEPWKSVVADADTWHSEPEPMRDWKTWGVRELANHDGMVWFRRNVSLTAAQAAGTASLSLGAIDEVDETWVNERAIANSFGWGTPRTYALPAGVLHAGENSIVVNVLSTWDAGGMYGPKEEMALRFPDGSRVPLGGEWRYQFVPESMGYPPRAPWESIGGLSSIHNAMIAPIEPYGLRGVLWYQGESNAGDAGHYQKLLAGLMSNWRQEFGAELPFLVVELPNFGAPPVAPTQSDWASLREAQRRAVAGDAHAALAVTIDVGDRSELHPPNKQEVGRRLARAARRLIYGEAISPSGPRPAGAQRGPAGIAVEFVDVEGKLITYSAGKPIGFELCGTTQESCRFADADMQSGHGVLLHAGHDDAGHDGAPPTRVRFCWGGAPVCNLFDQSGLPAGPFEIDIN